MNRAEQALDEMRSRLDGIKEERENFETWISLEYGSADLERLGFGYRRTAVDCMWIDLLSKIGLLEIHAPAK